MLENRGNGMKGGGGGGILKVDGMQRQGERHAKQRLTNRYCAISDYKYKRFFFNLPVKAAWFISLYPFCPFLDHCLCTGVLLQQHTRATSAKALYVVMAYIVYTGASSSMIVCARTTRNRSNPSGGSLYLCFFVDVFPGGDFFFLVVVVFLARDRCPYSSS